MLTTPASEICSENARFSFWLLCLGYEFFLDKNLSRLVRQLAVVAEGERVQHKTCGFRLQCDQMSPEDRAPHQIIHARLDNLDVSSLLVKLHVCSGAFFG